MNNEAQIKENILKKIQSGEIHMRPKFYFAFRLALLIALIAAILSFSAFLISFVLFGIRMSGRLFLLGLGFEGVKVFLITFPWILFLLDILLILVLERLLKRFRFAYQRPMVYVVAGLGIISLLLALAFYFSPIHSDIYRSARNRHVPFVAPLYLDAHRPPQEKGVFKGMIVEIQGNTFLLSPNRDFDDSTGTAITVIIPPNLIQVKPLSVGDKVFVAGILQDKSVRAYGIIRIGDEE